MAEKGKGADCRERGGKKRENKGRKRERGGDGAEMERGVGRK